MAKRLQYRRLLMLALLLAVAFAGLGYRLVDLQVFRHDELSAKAQHNTQREFLLQARRGSILDSRGNLLATSMAVKNVCADPFVIGNRYREMAHILAPLLKMNEPALAEQIKPRQIGTNAAGQPLWDQYVLLRRRVRVEEWQQITNVLARQTFGMPTPTSSAAKYTLLNLQQKAIFAEDDQLRVYPSHSLAAHVLGFTGNFDHTNGGKIYPEMRGMDGIEKTFDSSLRGVPGWVRTEKDSDGHEIVSLREQAVEPRNGLNVVLTIDAVIQHIVESTLADTMEKFNPVSVTAVVIRPRTGEILGMATLPTYDPNARPGNLDVMRNRVISDLMEPGSTFKTVVISGALNDRLVNLNDMFFCENGAFAFAGTTLHDSEGHHFGNLSVQDIIMKSSNIGAAKVGIKLGERRLYEYIVDFGFGSRTGILLPGEVNPRVHPFKDLYKVSIAQIPMGQGINVTRMQMAMAFSAIANGGRLMQPMIVDRVEDSDGNVVVRNSPQAVRQVISEPTARLMTAALKTVVSAEGTAPDAALERYTVAGKTGTAQKAGRGGYQPGKYYASFIGFFPADDPEVCIAVVLDEPDPHKGYYGGRTAAPAFREIATRTASYLNLRPDIEPPAAPGTVAQAEDRVPRTVVAR